MFEVFIIFSLTPDEKVIISVSVSAATLQPGGVISSMLCIAFEEVCE